MQSKTWTRSKTWSPLVKISSRFFEFTVYSNKYKKKTFKSNQKKKKICKIQYQNQGISTRYMQRRIDTTKQLFMRCFMSRPIRISGMEKLFLNIKYNKIWLKTEYKFFKQIINDAKEKNIHKLSTFIVKKVH